MKYFIIFATLFFANSLPAQLTSVPEPQYLVIDSRDNVFVTIKYGIIKISPDGTLTNLTKIPGTIGKLDRAWSNLIIDSKDNLYANDGNLIYNSPSVPTIRSSAMYLPARCTATSWKMVQ